MAGASGGDDGDAFVEVELGQANAAPLGLNTPFGAAGGRETVGLAPILAAAGNVRRCVRRRFRHGWLDCKFARRREQHGAYLISVKYVTKPA
jgi:hypothetical protein